MMDDLARDERWRRNVSAWFEHWWASWTMGATCEQPLLMRAWTSGHDHELAVRGFHLWSRTEEPEAAGQPKEGGG